MRAEKWCVMVLLAVMLAAPTVWADPQFRIQTFSDWEELLGPPLPDEPTIRPIGPGDWQDYMMQWQSSSEVEGLRYPMTEYCEPLLYAHDGSGFEHGEGMVMAWGQEMFRQNPEPDQKFYGSAWTYKYGVDPDLSNCTIQVTVTPPSGAGGTAPGNGITAVSFALRDINGVRRSWWWSVPGTIAYDQPTTVIINTSQMGVNATIPVATGFMPGAGFDITQVMWLDVDENFQYIFPSVPPPPPGSVNYVGAWNYWHNLIITKKDINANKGYHVKYSQPPVEIEPGLIYGWDELSVYCEQWQPVMADDWPCEDERPITDIHWWGSFLGWRGNRPPQPLPKAFHIGIWTDVPATADMHSHPGQMIWENICTSWTWNFAGVDKDPREDGMEHETCFQFNQLLNEDEWFYQEPVGPDGNANIYWLSIAAIYAPDTQIFYPWGWKTRPHVFNDDAVRIRDCLNPAGGPSWPPTIGSIYNGGEEVLLTRPDGITESWDLAFELTTNEEKCVPPKPADLDCSGFVDIVDLSVMSQQWLTVVP